VKHLQEKRDLRNLKHVIEYTDGCSSQYKCRGSFADVSYAKRNTGISFERNYFGSRHGKGPSDGVSGVVKSAVRRAVISRRVTVNTAEEMFNYCKEQLTRNSCKGQKRTFFYVQHDEIVRNRPESEVKAALAGTRLLHSVKGISPGVLDTRLLSCFCDGCLSDTECSNPTYVLPWQRRVLQLTHGVPEEPENVLPSLEDIHKDADFAEDGLAENIEDLWRKVANPGLFYLKRYILYKAGRGVHCNRILS
jgi:hypothetical protein